MGLLPNSSRSCRRRKSRSCGAELCWCCGGPRATEDHTDILLTCVTTGVPPLGYAKPPRGESLFCSRTVIAAPLYTLSILLQACICQTIYLAKFVPEQLLSSDLYRIADVTAQRYRTQPNTRHVLVHECIQLQLRACEVDQSVGSCARQAHITAQGTPGHGCDRRSQLQGFAPDLAFATLQRRAVGMTHSNAHRCWTL